MADCASHPSHNDRRHGTASPGEAHRTVAGWSSLASRPSGVCLESGECRHPKAGRGGVDNEPHRAVRQAEVPSGGRGRHARHVFITGGVVSSTGESIASSLGALLEAHGLRATVVKLDAYINVDLDTVISTHFDKLAVWGDSAGPILWPPAACGSPTGSHRGRGGPDTIGAPAQGRSRQAVPARRRDRSGSGHGAYASSFGGRSPRSRARCTASSRPRAPSFAKMPEIR